METSGLAEAIGLIQQTAQRAQQTVLNVQCPDGAGGQLLIPVAIVPDATGLPRAQSLMDTMEAGSRLARDLRLATAPGPDHRSGTAAHQTLESLITHANRFKAENSAVWADTSRRRLITVLDYHPEGASSAARWGRHRGAYECPLSEAWTAWGGVGGKVLDQDDFAELLESRDRELFAGKMPDGKTAPDPAALITLASNLEVYSTATAKRERDPNTGRVRISYSEDKGVNGAVMPPPAFLILIPVFQDSTPQPLEVRLRVTVEDGAAKFRVQIHAAGDVLRGAFDSICARVRSETELPVFHGTPE